MKIPSDVTERDNLFQDLVLKCMHTREKRNGDYATLRHFYLFGRGPDDADTPYNKIYPHIDLLTAFLFAAETTKFSTHLPPSAAEHHYNQVTQLNKAINDAWLMSNADHVFGQAITWSLVFGSTLVKLIIRAANGECEINPFVVDPSSFGVLREDTPYLDRQEAFCHTYMTTMSQLEADIDSHPRKEEILKNIGGAGQVAASNEMPSGADRLIIQSVGANITGNTNVPFEASQDYQPRVAEELIEMQELWVWDDDEDDYRVVTRVENGVTIFDRKNFFIKGESPFIHVCPNPLYSYFWGLSEVQGLVGLQKWRNERVIQMQGLLDREADPPTALTGWMGLVDETNFAMKKAGGVLATDSMQAKVEQFSPKIPEEFFNVIHEIDGMFAERSGLQNIMMGKGESGVRSGRQTSELARLASARIKKRALIVEDSLEKIATIYLKCLRKYSTADYMSDDGKPFIAEQFSDIFVVKVDGHSNSPLFVEDHKALAGELLEAKAIDRETMIEMLDPPMKEVMLRRLKVMEKKEAEQKQLENQLQSKNE